MFYEGDLQSGIATALRQSKQVVCFVKDDSEESQIWEDSLLRDDQVASNLASKAVSLVIRAGSQEASFLSAYYTISVVPTLLVINNGSLRSRLEAGLSEDQIKAGIIEAMSGTINPPAASLSRDTRPPQTPQAALSGTGTGGTNVYAASDLPDSNPQDVPDGQETKTEKGKERQESSSEVSSKAPGNTIDDPTKMQQARQVKDQRKRQREAKAERERIVRQIAADKVERREKEELRRAQAKLDTEKLQAGVNESARGLPQTVDKGKSILGKECNLQIRTLDGSTLRRRFPIEQTVGTNVRRWVKQENASGARSYTFRQILTPLPNRLITDSDEEETLGALGLAPSATLIMVPVKGSVAAYSNQPGFLSGTIVSLYSIITGWLGLLLQYIRTFLGAGQTDSSHEPGGSEGSSEVSATGTQPATSTGVKIRRLYDQDEKKDHQQLYNGNQLNFEPRRSSDDEDG